MAKDRDREHADFGLGRLLPPPSPVQVRVTWWSRGTRSKEIDGELVARGDTVTLELYDDEKITVERRS